MFGRIFSFILALSSLSLLGCGIAPADQYAVHIDPAFSPDEMDTILQALTEWSQAVENLSHHSLHFVPDISRSNCGDHGLIGPNNEKHSICILRSSLQETHDLGAPIVDAGFTFRRDSIDSATIRMSMDEIARHQHSNVLFRTSLEHEIGHAMGLQHDVVASSIMYYNMCVLGTGCIMNDELTQRDVDQYVLMR